MSFRKIVVALDGTPAGETVLPHVEALAGCVQDAHIILMRTAPPPGGTAGSPEHEATELEVVSELHSEGDLHLGRVPHIRARREDLTLAADNPPRHEHVSGDARGAYDSYLFAALQRVREKGFRADMAAADMTNPPEEIGAYAARVGADLVALAHHPGGRLRHVLHRSVFDELLEEWDGPVLVVRR